MSPIDTSSPTKSPVNSRFLQQDAADADWLKSLTFRDGAFPPLAAAARQGDLPAFGPALLQAYEQECHLGKRERSRMLVSLEILWSQIDDRKSALSEEGSLAHCLFDRNLSGDELSGRLEAIMAGDAEGGADRSTLVAACWLIRLRGKQLESHTLFTLLRWVLVRSPSRLAPVNDKGSDSPCSGADFDRLELQLLLHGVLPGVKGEKKDWREIVDGWHVALDAATDNDGTPHAAWLPQILSKCCQLAAATLYADSLNLPLWSKKDLKRLQGLFVRTSLLLTPRQMTCGDVSPAAAAHALKTIAEVLHLESQSGLLALLKQLAAIHTGSARKSGPRRIQGKFPKANTQSDWGDWACLRSGWNGPVDQCVVRHDQPVPLLDVVAADLPLFTGAWEHSLTVDGKPVTSTGEWSCCCWYEDRSATFMELQLNREDPVQLVRQLLLLREESILMIADSIRLPAAARIEFQRRLPLASGWNVEEDSLSREVALWQGQQRIRIFPWTSPQMRLDRSDETLTVTDEELCIDVQAQGTCLYVSTLLDWSDKRREDPIDWRRVTVAEDGKIMPADLAVGYRLRLGKKQWVLYHSHRPPHFPRSVLGIHTLSETVFARLSPRGEADPLVEVEL